MYCSDVRDLQPKIRRHLPQLHLLQHPDVTTNRELETLMPTDCRPQSRSYLYTWSPEFRTLIQGTHSPKASDYPDINVQTLLTVAWGTPRCGVTGFPDRAFMQGYSLDNVCSRLPGHGYYKMYLDSSLN